MLGRQREKDNIIDFINYPSRIFPIGRLDKPSEGLIFLTNDGDIVNKILRANNQHEKECNSCLAWTSKRLLHLENVYVYEGCANHGINHDWRAFESTTSFMLRASISKSLCMLRARLCRIARCLHQGNPPRPLASGRVDAG